MSFRVTQRSMNSQVMANLQRNLGKMGTIQEQLSSGKQIAKPSDSPTGTVTALQFRSEIRRSDQMLRNADDALGWLGTADGTLSQAVSVVGKARELVLQGGNGSYGTEARSALAAEIDAIRENLLSLANTTYLGRPLFNGTENTSQAYGADGTYAGTPVGTYVDPDGATRPTGHVNRTVADGVSVRVNLLGPEVFGGEGPLDPTAGNLFAVLEKAAADLRSGSPTLTNETLKALDARVTGIHNALATVGARYNQVETMRERTTDARLQQTNGLAEVESIDLPASIMQLQMQEVAYQAALSATQRVIQPSLVSFLR